MMHEFLIDIHHLTNHKVIIEMSTTRSIVLFRRDLRVSDNPALSSAAETSEEILPLFIWNPDDSIPFTLGGASKWWLHHSLYGLETRLKDCGLVLHYRCGNQSELLLDLCKKHDISAVHWNRFYDPSSIAQDTETKALLKGQGTTVHSHKASVLLEPWEIQTSSGGPFQVYTPFWRKFLTCYQHASPLPKPSKCMGVVVESLQLKDLHLLPTIPWDSDFPKYWQPGEERALKTLEAYVAQEKVGDYSAKRDYPSIAATSLLAAPLHFGEVSPKQVWEAVVGWKGIGKHTEPFLRQIVWREFAHHLLYHFPHTPDKPLREKYAKFPWRDDADHLLAWQRGMTGYPIVDAGMRQLWATGTMHNRVRMIVASFLVKHLLLPWQEGAHWFWDTLVDADLANNTLGWQWAAGCGADAAPYFRIFNPILQSKKFDAKGEYIRRWVPELERLSDKQIHTPWEVSPLELSAAGVKLGREYPFPIVDHKEARQRALDAYEVIKG